MYEHNKLISLWPWNHAFAVIVIIDVVIIPSWLAPGSLSEEWDCYGGLMRLYDHTRNKHYHKQCTYAIAYK